ncbi:hypothetical protein J1614_006440 [Plenodomus biglobosus]|nr:hypothetical protein J1614_006440 [Plenodomus biglobosus]
MPHLANITSTLEPFPSSIMAIYKIIIAGLIGLTIAQTPGRTQEKHPKLRTFKCDKAGGCKPLDTAIVLDSSFHPIHQKNTSSCILGNGLDPAVCPDEKTCAVNCIMEGIQDYAAYGVTTKGAHLELDIINSNGSVVRPRVYLLAENGKNYEMLKLTGKEFSFDVDVSKLPCGMNGALYLSEMEADGGRQALNPGGATYGTGYCDAQCFVTPWINGVGNVKGKGVCCNEMDIWEANSRANQIAPHTCDSPSLFSCTGDECKSNGKCDKAGCGDNPYRHRNAKDYYGPGLKVDTKKPFTVVTQFPADNHGVLQAIVRKYVQDGIVIENAAQNITMDQAYCSAQAGAENYNRLGGHKGMGEALARGMVLAMSIWWDESGGMQWLDAGGAGPCNAAEGFPDEILKVEKAPVVKFSNIMWGEIESTYRAQKNSSRHHHWKA